MANTKPLAEQVRFTQEGVGAGRAYQYRTLCLLTCSTTS